MNTMIGLGQISEEEIAEHSVLGNLPDRPAYMGLYGEGGYSADEIKAQFDALPRLIIDYFNAFVEDIGPLLTQGKLPAVTLSDNGSFLTVQDGIWKAVKIKMAEEVIL